MKKINYLMISFACINMAHAASEDNKAIAQEAYRHVLDIKSSSCRGDDILSVSSDALSHLLKLKDNKGLTEDICLPQVQNPHCKKEEVPESFRLELNAVTDCIQHYKMPHVPANLPNICCNAATKVANYLEKYLRGSES